jgi:hypothetical protein
VSVDGLEPVAVVEDDVVVEEARPTLSARRRRRRIVRVVVLDLDDGAVEGGEDGHAERLFTEAADDGGLAAVAVLGIACDAARGN